MGLLDKLFGRETPPPATKPLSMARRGFDSGRVDRTNSNWPTVPESANRELRYTLRNMRARSRHLANNNEYAARFIDLCSQNIVGPDGVGMEPNGKNAQGKPDEANNEAIEDAWQRWGRRGSCTVDGLSWADAQRLIIECVARDGEVLIKPIIGPAAGNEFNFALQILEADYLDEQFSKNQDASGAGIFMGVEWDSYGRTLAYYLLTYNPADYGYAGGTSRVRVPAKELLHVFAPRRAQQRRGVPWMTPSMSSLYQLGDFKNSELVATRVAAAKMGFYVQNGELAAPMTSDDVGAEDEPIQEVEPGMFEKLPYGMDFKTVDWNHPNINFDQFVKSCLRGSAAGMGVGYNKLASDLEGVNYSSLREGRLDETDMWRTKQRWFTEWVCQPIYSMWLDMAITSGQLPIPSSKSDKYRFPKWCARGWGWVDPQKEAEANRIAIALGLRSRTQILAEQGKDFDDVLEEITAENAAMRAAGLDPTVTLSGGAAPQGQDKPATPEKPTNGD